MALETGGRASRNSNDLTVAYAHARRELSCRYTIGFHDEHPEEERSHDVHVKVKRAGLRVASPIGYAFRSQHEKKTSILTTAFINPSMFDNGFVRTHIFPIKPVGKRTWECSVAVEFPLPMEEGPATEREFAVFVRKGSQKVLGFDRKVMVKRALAHGAGSRTVSFSQPAQLAPGTYTVTAIVGDHAHENPYASSAQVVIPPVPDGDLFLVPPLLGRPAKADLVVHAAADEPGSKRTSDDKAKQDQVGDASSFLPLFVQSAKRKDPVLVMTQVCAKGRLVAASGASISRAIEREDGGVTFQWPDEPLNLAPVDGYACRPMMDVLPVAYLAPGDYVFKASVGTADASSFRLPFRLETTGEQPHSTRR